MKESLAQLKILRATWFGKLLAVVLYLNNNTYCSFPKLASRFSFLHVLIEIMHFVFFNLFYGSHKLNVLFFSQHLLRYVQCELWIFRASLENCVWQCLQWPKRYLCLFIVLRTSYWLWNNLLQSQWIYAIVPSCHHAVILVGCEYIWWSNWVSGQSISYLFVSLSLVKRIGVTLYSYLGYKFGIPSFTNMKGCLNWYIGVVGFGDWKLCW